MAEYGYIVANVRTARGAIPIEGAMVTISQIVDGINEIISVDYTDSSGVTPSIKVETPPRKLTYEQDNKIKPYTEYQISTDKNGYYSVNNINVPVYSGVTSIQPVELIPVQENIGIDFIPEYNTRFNESQAPDL